MDETGRCPWCGTDPLYVAYHDEEWGVPEWDGRALYEKLMLDGFQAGLSWYTILKKRPAFRTAFDDFDPQRIARYGEADVDRLLADAGIVRHRGTDNAWRGQHRSGCRDASQESSAHGCHGSHSLLRGRHAR